MPLELFDISLVSSVLISILYQVQVLSRISTRASSFISYSIYVIGKPQICNISVAYGNRPIMFFQGKRHDPFEKNVEGGGLQKTALPWVVGWRDGAG